MCQYKALELLVLSKLSGARSARWHNLRVHFLFLPLRLHSQGLVRTRSLIPFQTTSQQNLFADFGRSSLNLRTSVSQKETLSALDMCMHIHMYV